MTAVRIPVLLLVLAVIGCGGGTQPQPQGKEVTVSVPTPTPVDPSKPPEVVPVAPSAPARDALHQSFESAIRSADDPPTESNRPPDRTLAGKGSFALYQQIQKDWDGVRFTTSAGKKITWTATIETDRGVIDLAFFPEAAPNHVRNFLSLCKAGYFDGLCFERTHEEEAADMAGKLEQVEFGCPEGTGEPGKGSLGYWLKPEFNKIAHDEGILGALRGIEEDTSACRYYINLRKAAFLDGRYTVLGKVTRGLDVARIIFQQPIHPEDAQRPGSKRVAMPVKIVKVSLQPQEG